MRFTADRLEARMHLPDLVEIVADPSDPASREAVSAINLKLADVTDSTFTPDLMTRMPGVVVRQTARSRDDDPFVVLERFHVAISVVTMIAGTAFLLALMVIRAEERRETVGILRLVGISRRTLLASVAIEGLVVAALGAAFGILLAYVSEGLNQSYLSGTLRYGAGVRASDAVDRAAGDRRGGAARHSCRHRRVVDAPAPRSAVDLSPMTSASLAWRTVRRYRARTLLAITGVAVIGALLFDMLLLSRGLLLSFADLLDKSGFDIRVVSSEGLSARQPISGSTALAADIGRIPGVRNVLSIRIEPATARIATRPPRGISLVGSSGTDDRVWRVLQGASLASPAAAAEPCPVLATRGLATAFGLGPGAMLTINVRPPGIASALPAVTCRVVGVAEFAFAPTDDLTAVTTSDAFRQRSAVDPPMPIWCSCRRAPTRLPATSCRRSRRFDPTCGSTPTTMWCRNSIATASRTSGGSRSCSRR